MIKRFAPYLIVVAIHFTAPSISEAESILTVVDLCSYANPTDGANCISVENQQPSASTSVNSVSTAVGSTGQFDGSGTATGEAGSLGVSTSVQVSDYPAGSNVYPTAEYNARSQAIWFDTVTVTGLPDVYDLTMTFDLDGSLGAQVGLWSSIWFSFEMWTPGSPTGSVPFPVRFHR